jgi:hypothetical protein
MMLAPLAEAMMDAGQFRSIWLAIALVLGLLIHRGQCAQRATGAGACGLRGIWRLGRAGVWQRCAARKPTASCAAGCRSVNAERRQAMPARKR